MATSVLAGRRCRSDKRGRLSLRRRRLSDTGVSMAHRIPEPNSRRASTRTSWSELAACEPAGGVRGVRAVAFGRGGAALPFAGACVASLVEVARRSRRSVQT